MPRNITKTAETDNSLRSLKDILPNRPLIIIFHRFEIGFRMAARGTQSGRLGCLADITAVTALPPYFMIAHEEIAIRNTT